MKLLYRHIGGGAALLGLLLSLTISVRGSTDTQELEKLIRHGDEAMQASRDRADPSLYQEAVKSYRAALAKDPRSAAAMLGLAWAYNSDHQFESGRLWAERALEVDSGLAEAYSLIGDIELEFGRYDAAFEAYQKALDLEPNLSTYSRAAVMAWTTGDEGLGIKLMELAISAGALHAENTAWCQAQLAAMLFDRGQLEKALGLVAVAAESAPMNPLVLAVQGRLLRASGDRESALAVFERSVDTNPTHEALASLVDLYRESGREKDADTAYKRLLHYHDNHHGVEDHHHHGHDGGHHHEIASAQLALFWADRDMELKRAEAAAEAAYRAWPNIWSADALAWSYYKNGKLKNAVRKSKEALAWNTPSPDIYYRAGMISLAQGDLENARKHLKRALNLNPQFDEKGVSSAKNALRAIKSEGS